MELNITAFYDVGAKVLADITDVNMVTVAKSW